jgi:tripartite-type tricarboxylate transporter receptor subunit TctC
MSVWFHHQARIRAAYVPYKGTANTVIDLLGGQIDAMFSAGVTTIPHIKTGKLRGIGISSAQRSKELPDIPTIVEQGVQGFEAGTFHGWAAPAGTPPAIINKLSAELARIAKLPEITEKLRADNAVAVGSTPEQFAQLISSQIQHWRKLVKELNITVDE